MSLLLWILISFVSSSVPWSLILGFVFSKSDIRTIGDKNPGGTNTIKLSGIKVGLIAILLDISKSSIYYNLSSFKYSSIESIISFMDDNECKKAEKLIETCTNFKHFNIKNINRRIADYFIEKKSYNIFNNFQWKEDHLIQD